MKDQALASTTPSDEFELVTSEIVMPQFLNHHGKLFGGQLLLWLDKAGAMYALEKFEDKSIVTVEMQNVFFSCSPEDGDQVKIFARVKKLGHASVWLEMIAQNFSKGNIGDRPTVIRCDIRFAFLSKIKNKPV